ncbi:MAG: U32 family peptidase [Clostridiales bacterium]|nr:U32 family peptidase [Clostridiales bacterium]
MKDKILAPEILAPCGSLESVYAAIRCGANAVYLGGKNFSARQNAANFNTDELKKAVDYCHLFGAKVYLTVNTVLFDTELENFNKHIIQSALTGVDAFIIQDLGAYEIIRKTIPDIPLHASTQMTIHSPNGALLAKEMGFSRIVVARELSKKQIAEICKTGIEVEVFVHGALCVSVSGQCYMSAVIGSRSANRGLCAQACRLPFTSHNDSNACALSLKDLSLIEYLQELAEIGVSSFKIEGRMKRPEYVAAAVSSCVKALKNEKVDTHELRSVFSRSGFTDGYYTDNRKNMFGVRQKDDVTSAFDVLPNLKKLYEKERKAASISFNVSIHKDSPTVITSTDSNGFSVRVEGDSPQIALNKPTDTEQLEKQLKKLGNTIYNFEKVTADIDEGIMLPAASINELRRKAVGALNEERIRYFTPKYEIVDKNIEFITATQSNGQPLIRVQLKSIEQLKGVNIDDVGFIILPIMQIEENLSYLTPLAEKIIIEPPRFIINENEIINRLRMLKNTRFKRLLCNNIAYIRIGQELNLRMHGDFGLNITNSYSLKYLSDNSFEDTVLSFELKVNQITKLYSDIPLGIVAYGRLPLMLTRICPIKNEVGCRNCKKTLTDRTGRKIIVDCYDDYVQLLNPEILYLADKIYDFKNISFIKLIFHEETADEVRNVINQYINHKKCPFDRYTRGLYNRGII